MIRHALAALAVLLPLLSLALGGCTAAVVPLAAAEATSDMVLGRGIADIGVSAVTGRDCSTVRLDKGLPYCAPRGTLPGPLAFCTRTLGTVTCWKDPENLDASAHSVTDNPSLTPEQAKLVTARWPKSLNLGD